MLPAHVAENIRKQVQFYLQSTFDFCDKKVEKAFERFLGDPENGLFKGPWVQLQRPFRRVSEDAAYPLDIKKPFTPYRHQMRAWQRLSSKGQEPKPTLVTTGTGSGKTECFLYPMLDHCLRAKNTGQKGIKAIVLYPMNALASDQEKRFGETIWKDKDLKKAGIRVGNYTGRYDPADPGASADSGTKAMGPGHGITNHAVQQEDPPDILLTNYKMLDFLLMRPQDQKLWRYNEPDVLKYLVLDELHTYDGAQGADVACLIRRLKERLGIERGKLCVVGTSATMDSRGIEKDSDAASSGKATEAGGSANDRLADFASTLFEEDITPEAVIGEDRLEVEEIVQPKIEDLPMPEPSECDPLDDEDALKYAIRQSELWGGPIYIESDDTPEELAEKAIEEWSVELGSWLKRTYLFKYLLDIFRESERNKEGSLTWNALVERLSNLDLGIANVQTKESRQKLVISFFALVAHGQELRSGMAFPLVPTQVQLWIRELRRVGRIVSDAPAFAWLDEPPAGAKCLPTFHCGECGESGWIGLHNPEADDHIHNRGVEGIQLEGDPTLIYRNWFGQHGRKSQHIVVVSPINESEDAVLENDPKLSFEDDYFCPASLVLRKGDGECPLTEDSRRFRVRINRDFRKDEKTSVIYGDQGCPRCGSKVGVFFIGSQAATLSSVAIDEMFGTSLNNDPKLLAFTDSVQDASHRAGFFTSRTYHFTYRTALQHIIDDAGDKGLPLATVGRNLLDYWSKPGRLKDIRETIASLLPPDLQEYQKYLDYRNNSALNAPPKELREEIETRLTWEATSEFGLMKTHGRTMEASGSSCVGWDEKVIDQTIRELVDELEGIDTALTVLNEKDLRLWLFGLLQRYRERGALDHGYLLPFAKQRFWGKTPFGRAMPYRETYPPSMRYMPRLLVTHRQREHEYVLGASQGRREPWHIIWTRRSLGKPLLDETTIIDLLSTFLKVGSRSGLLKRLHQDGSKEYYAIAADAAILYSSGVHLSCGGSGRSIVRPITEAEIWEGAPSLDYYDKTGQYEKDKYNLRQSYYQQRYRKGALRRVVAQEHTGLLATELREEVESTFKAGLHADDPNILTCTSTLEMGIDIGNLSSTMLCSIPPNTASYLQRIGRAGRSTGTALILSIVNQRPHDLFFYARPVEMLRGRVDPPGCWLDASAVLVRQYLAYCFDSATKNGELKELPKTGKLLVDDLSNENGNITKMFSWITPNEGELRSDFMKRFGRDIRPDTRSRFIDETDTDLIRQRIYKAANEYDRLRRDLENAKKRLQSDIKKLDKEEKDDIRELEQELGIISGRLRGLSRISALEILTDHGLLPNYAFPERGVRFYGSVYNKHQATKQSYKPIELSRPAGVALKELAPGNSFYTHRRQFVIQQLAIGNPNQSILAKWAICGNCGHMRLVEELNQAEASPSCPQCGHDGDGNGQTDIGQQRDFIEFSQSQSLSYMEHYESLSADRNEERQRQYYKVIRSFDQTIEAPVGAVGDDSLPFGIEYLASLIMREVNVGYLGLPETVAFGSDTMASDTGFLICRHCGIVVQPNENHDKAAHRRSCHARRRYEKMKQEGKAGNPFRWENVYLYRQLRSEAIRLLLPLTDDEDFDTLMACIYLGLRLKFEGNPAHLIVASQILPDIETGIKKYYLVLMDAVPGGTGYLKTLYQSKDDLGREGEGVIEVLRLALNTLETCSCRKLKDDVGQQDTDGCYRCLRTFHQQYNADSISRERGIVLLRELIESGEKRSQKKKLDAIKPDSLFGSVLEKRFVDRIKVFVHEKQGKWEQTIIKGARGFRFSMPQSSRIWELELQPLLGNAQGVMVDSRPDFLLSCDDESIKPLAIFTDGFAYHCYPNNRLADDIEKRRAILESGNYYVWNISWDDLKPENEGHFMVCHQQIADLAYRAARVYRDDRNPVPDSRMILRNGLEQLKAFLDCPVEESWKKLANFIASKPLSVLIDKRKVMRSELNIALKDWQNGAAMAMLKHTDSGEWIYNDRASLNQDIITYISLDDALCNNSSNVTALVRLGDSESEVTGSDYCERWRRFHACLNLYQFCDLYKVWATSEIKSGYDPEILFTQSVLVSEMWDEVIKEVTTPLRPYVQKLAVELEDLVPQVEFFNNNIDDDAFAELAWPEINKPIVILAGDQISFSEKWQGLGWQVVVPEDIHARGITWLIDLLRKSI